jgi:phosphatidylinositol/phosphatidylcholine transfer protein
VERLGKLDIKALDAITTQHRLLQRLVFEYEKFLNDRLPACSIHIGQPVETSCTILDLKGVGLLQFWKVQKYVGDAAEIGQLRYPECMGKFFIINAPFGFSTVWNIIKGWLDPVTVAKISILGSDYESVLRAQIPPENLPSDIGGQCRCPGGCSLSDTGPWRDPTIMAQVAKNSQAAKARELADVQTPTPTSTAPEPTPLIAPSNGTSEIHVHPQAALQT